MQRPAEATDGMTAEPDGVAVYIGRGWWAARDGLGGVVVRSSEDAVLRAVMDLNGETAE